MTPGDTLLYLPAEKIVIAGDLLINPITDALGCYPTEWLHTLERIDALDAVVIVPDHGEPMRDKTVLRTTIRILRELLSAGKTQGPAAWIPTRHGKRFCRVCTTSCLR